MKLHHLEMTQIVLIAKYLWDTMPGKNLEIIGQSIDDDQTFHVIKETLAKMWQALKEFHDGDKPSTIREFL